MPCYNKDIAQARLKRSEAERSNSERDAIIIDTSPEEELFMQSCAIHCEIECCGFNALELSEPQVRRAVHTIGVSTAQLALASMRANKLKIGNHTGLIRFRGYFEETREVSEGYKLASDVLNKIIKEGEEGADGNAEQAV